MAALCLRVPGALAMESALLARLMQPVLVHDRRRDFFD
jgi:hypothetical protein